jgi:cadmium resistance protein CadD (predicted permease)
LLPITGESVLNPTDVAALGALVLSSFAATNLDNLLVLVFLLGNAAHRKTPVLLGFITSVTAVVSVAAFGVVIGVLVDPAQIGYLGLAPIAMGCYLLYQQRRPVPAENEDATGGALPNLDENLRSRAGAAKIWFGSSVLMLSNSGDSVAVLLPLVAESGFVALVLIFGLYLAASLLWCALALSIASRPGLAARIQRYGLKLVPWVVMLVGVYVLLDSRTDTLM